MKCSILPPYDKPGSYQAAEVRWYRRYGINSSRIKVDGSGHPYVIGDRDWNKRSANKEYVEDAMKASLGPIEIERRSPEGGV